MLLERHGVVLAGAHLNGGIDCLLIGCQLEPIRLRDEAVQDTNSALAFLFVLSRYLIFVFVSSWSWIFVKVFLKLDFSVESSLFVSKLMFPLHFHTCVGE